MKNITRRELVFIFIIVQLVIFCGGLLIAYFFGKITDTAVIVNQISLVSSFTSIILALVAIIYAFFQSYSSSQQNQMLHDTLNKINQKIEELVSIKTDVADLRSELTNQLTTVLGGLEDTKATLDETDYDNNKEELNKKLSTLEDSIKNIILKNYLSSSEHPNTPFEFRVYASKKDHAEHTEIYEWIKDLVSNLTDVFLDSGISFGNVIYEGESFNFKLTVYTSDKKTAIKIRNLIAKIDGDKFKVERVLIKF